MIKHADFLIWMLIYPVVCSFGKFINEYLIKNTYSKEVNGFAAFFTLMIYFGVAVLLWKN